MNNHSCSTLPVHIALGWRLCSHFCWPH